MEKMIDLKDLLKHEIMDLHSAEEQIIEALPLMIDKANNNELKKALQDHLEVTEKQKIRLEELQEMLTEAGPAGEGEPAGNAEPESGESAEGGEPAKNEQEAKKPGFFSRLFGGGSQKCKGMEGLITEGKKMMAEDMSPEASDAAIIAGAQKIEHYEICGYGTARAYARELNLGEVASKLEQTLNEEYEADDLLTRLAVGKVNVEAEFAEDPEKTNRPGSNKGGSRRGSAAAKKGGPARSSGRSAAKGAPATKSKSAAKSSSKTASKSSKSPAKTSAAKSAAKSAAGKSGAKGRSAPAKKSGAKTSAGKKSAGKGGAKASAGKKSAAKGGSAGRKASSKSKSSRVR